LKGSFEIKGNTTCKEKTQVCIAIPYPILKIIVKWFIFTCFLNALIPLVVLYMINSILVRVFDLNSNLDCYKKKYNAWLKELLNQKFYYH